MSEESKEQNSTGSQLLNLGDFKDFLDLVNTEGKRVLKLVGKKPDNKYS
jgi:hypothetical protein